LGFYFTSFTYPATGFSLFSWSNASLFISNSTITDINNAGGWVVQCLNFARCSVHDTLFEDIIGGSVLATQNATLVLHDTKIKSNKGDHLGAVRIIDSMFHMNRVFFKKCQTTGIFAFQSAGEITNSKFTSNIDSTVTDPTSCGGAIHLEECDLVLLTNMTFISNRAFNGGALCSVRTDIITSNMTFDNNWAVRDCGGALAFPAGWPVAIEVRKHLLTYKLDHFCSCYRYILQFYDSVFINNAANRYGGGLCADYAIISNAQFYYNRAGKGGGYYAPLVDTVSNATFAYNYASEAGGAMYLGTEGNSIGGIETSVFENNTSDGSGGCIYVEDDVFVAATVFRNCKSEGFGGGIFIGGTSEQSAQVDLDHVLFENNVAVSGGAVFVGGVLTKTDIRDATFVNNYAIVNGANYIADNYFPISI
jgi:predicted outer membrane repeat protein